jgi:hypothetical protein
MTAQAPHLDPLAGAGATQYYRQGLADSIGVLGYTEIGPLDVRVIPGRSPSRIEVQPVVGLGTTGVGVLGIEGGCRQRRAVWQHDQVEVAVNLEYPMLVVFVLALGLLDPRLPILSGLSTGHDRPNLGHATR